jgi:hypothetical protein
MSNLDWFRLWTMEHDKQPVLPSSEQGQGGGFGDPGGERDGRIGDRDGFDGDRDGIHGNPHAHGGDFGYGGMNSGHSIWAPGDTGWRPHLFSETSQTENPTYGSGRSFGPDYEAPGQGCSHSPSPYAAPHGGDDGHGIFGGHGGAGGDFDAILFGHLDAGGLHAGFGPGAIVVIPIEHLEINQNTLIQNTNILFDAHDGGSVSVGGNVTAVSSQTGLIDHQPDMHAIAA